MNGVIYARYSCSNQREESIEGQLRECIDYAKKNNISIICEYIDRAYSAKTDNRPEFQRMIKESYRKNYDVVLVWKLDRFSRNRYDSARYKTILKKNGIQVISATENISQTAEGIILEAVLEGFAEYYSADLSEKVLRGMKENVLKNKFNGGSRTIGYYIDENQNFHIDEQTAPYIKNAFEMFSSGVSKKNICDFLNSHNVRTSKGTLINYDTLRRMLKNKRYIGEYKVHEIYSPNGIPAIVSEDLFYRVQERFHNTRSSTRCDKNDYVLSGLLKCKSCHRNMVGESGTSKTGKIYYYYKCQGVKRGLGCKIKSPKQEEIEAEVLKHVVGQIFTDGSITLFVKEILKQNKKENVAILSLKKEYNNVSVQINNLVLAISQGVQSEALFNKLHEFETFQCELEKQMVLEKGKSKREKLTEEKIVYWMKNGINKLSTPKKSLLVHFFVEEIYFESSI